MGRQSYQFTPKNVSVRNKVEPNVVFGCCVWSGTDEENSVSGKLTGNLHKQGEQCQHKTDLVRDGGKRGGGDDIAIAAINYK